MHLWNINAVELALSSNDVPEHEGLKYYAASAIANLVFVEYSLWWGPRHGWLFLSELTVLLLITAWGLMTCWTANGSGESKNIIVRMVCLSVPIGIRTNLLAIGAGLVLFLSRDSLLGNGAFRDPGRAYDFLSYGLFISVAVLYWKMLAGSLRRITLNTKNNERET